MIDRELKDITKKSAFVFLGRIFGSIMGFFFSLIAARLMGAAVYGQIVYVMTIIILLTVITKLGLSEGLVQNISKLTTAGKLKRRNSLISFSILTVVISSSFIAIFIFIFSDFIALNILNKSQLSNLLKIMSPFLIIFTLVELSPGIYRGIKVIRHHVIGNSLILTSLKLISLIITGYLGYRINGLIFSYYISFTFALIYLYYKIYKLNLLGTISKKEISSYKNLLIFSYPLFMSGLLHFFIARIDIFMIGYFLNSSDVGIYTIALKVGTLINFMLFSFNTIFAPNIASLFYNNQLEKLKRLYQVITKWIFTLNIFVFALILLLSKEIMTVFGSEFIIGSAALILISIGQLFNAAVGTAGSVNVMTGYPKSELYISIIVFVLNISLNYYLIPRYGINGAAFASLISVSVMNLARLSILYLRLKFLPYTRGYLNVIYSAFAAYLICFVIKKYISLNYLIMIITVGLIFLLIFTTLNYIFGLEEADKMIFKAIKRKLLG